MGKFTADCLPVLIGSLPVKNHKEARELVFRYTPEIPLWGQLPAYREEGMVAQFLPGLPGLSKEVDKVYVDTTSDGFDQEVLEFYEEFMAVSEGGKDLADSRFAMTPETARGFFGLIEHLERARPDTKALKGQVTGPVTFCTGLADENGKSIFYNDQLRDMAVKLLAMKAGWQIKKLSKFNPNTIIFFDEPALTGFGSSAFISISRQDILACFEEVMNTVHDRGGLTGVHVCANADWSLIMESTADILSFDAYGYFDTLMLYPKQLASFMERGGILAWGIVPTLSKEDIEKESTESIFERWKEMAEKIESVGIDRGTLHRQSLITPSCGTGSLSSENAVKVLQITAEVSQKIRDNLD